MNNIQIQNNGPEIASTNYWESEYARRGIIYLSFNAGAARLLLPPPFYPSLTEMDTGRLVILSLGQLDTGQTGYELLFGDYSDSPYSILVGTQQTDRLLSKSDSGRDLIVSVWCDGNKKLELPAKFRVVESVPCLKPWPN